MQLELADFLMGEPAGSQSFLGSAAVHLDREDLTGIAHVDEAALAIFVLAVLTLRRHRGDVADLLDDLPASCIERVLARVRLTAWQTPGAVRALLQQIAELALLVLSPDHQEADAGRVLSLS